MGLAAKLPLIWRVTSGAKTLHVFRLGLQMRDEARRHYTYESGLFRMTLESTFVLLPGDLLLHGMNRGCMVIPAQKPASIQGIFLLQEISPACNLSR